jgi:hypothetical protein
VFKPFWFGGEILHGRPRKSPGPASSKRPAEDPIAGFNVPLPGQQILRGMSAAWGIYKVAQRKNLMQLSFLSKSRQLAAAFSFVEVLMATGVSGLMFMSLYAGFSTGFALIQLSRENLRGTEILQDKLETIRLYNWNQLTNTSFVPTSFVETFYPGTQANNGITYTGKVTIAPAPISENYSNDLRLVTVEVQWISANVLRKRDMSTFVSRYGLQNYIY